MQSAQIGKFVRADERLAYRVLAGIAEHVAVDFCLAFVRREAHVQAHRLRQVFHPRGRSEHAVRYYVAAPWDTHSVGS